MNTVVSRGHIEPRAVKGHMDYVLFTALQPGAYTKNTQALNLSISI